MSLTVHSSVGWPTLKRGAWSAGHWDFSGSGLVVCDPNSEAPRIWHYSFDRPVGVVCDSEGELTTRHYDFADYVGVVCDTYATVAHYDFASVVGVVCDADDSGASDDTPAVPVVVDEADWWLEIDVSEVTCGTDAACDAGGKIRAGSTSRITAVASSQLDCVQPSFGVDVTLDSAGAAPSAQANGDSIYGLLSDSPDLAYTWDTGAPGRGLRKAIANVCTASAYGLVLPARTSPAQFSVTARIGFLLPGHLQPLWMSAGESIGYAAEAVREALELDGLAVCVAIEGATDPAGFVRQRQSPSVQPWVAWAHVSIFPILTGGRFRFKVGGADEYSGWLDLKTCTVAQVNAAIAAMPTVIDRGGLACRRIARMGPYPATSTTGATPFYCTASNDLFMEF